MSEEWKDIQGYEGIYQVSNQGRVKVLRKWDVNLRDYVPGERIITPVDNGHGYLAVYLALNGKKCIKYIHRLVAKAFIENPFGKPEINHKDYDKYNNDAVNLEWCNRQENINYSISNMCHPKNSKPPASGYKYIYAKHNPITTTYRVCVPGHREIRARNLYDAITMRDGIMKGGDAINGEFVNG